MSNAGDRRWLELCALKFREYEALHEAKGTEDGHGKAATNRLMAMGIEHHLIRTRPRWWKWLLRYLALEAICTLAFVSGALIGMEFDPNNEYCANRTHLTPTDCHYEQSSDQPGDEVCK